MSSSATPAAGPITVQPDPDERAAARQLRRRAHNAAVLTRLFVDRTDLDGVSPTAQFYADSVRWTA